MAKEISKVCERRAKMFARAREGFFHLSYKCNVFNYAGLAVRQPHEHRRTKNFRQCIADLPFASFLYWNFSRILFSLSPFDFACVKRWLFSRSLVDNLQSFLSINFQIHNHNYKTHWRISNNNKNTKIMRYICAYFLISLSQISVIEVHFPDEDGDVEKIRWEINEF